MKSKIIKNKSDKQDKEILKNFIKSIIFNDKISLNTKKIFIVSLSKLLNDINNVSKFYVQIGKLTNFIVKIKITIINGEKSKNSTYKFNYDSNQFLIILLSKNSTNFLEDYPSIFLNFLKIYSKL